jgi:putative aldouronate transport system permease protein
MKRVSKQNKLTEDRYGTSVNQSKRRKSSLFYKLWKYRVLLLMCTPAILFFFLFSYLPMPGVYILHLQISIMLKGIFGSPFVGLKNFEFLFDSGQLGLLTRNTVLYNSSVYYFWQFSSNFSCGT